MKITRLLVSVVFSAFVGNAYSSELKPFTSDGCSSFPDGTFEHKLLWRNCCVVHDKAYWQGGTADQRKLADLELESCVAEVGEPNIAKLMLAGVRVGGSPHWPTQFRWGYGWDFPRGYGELLTEEKAMVAEKWKAFESTIFKDRTIKNPQ